MKEVKSWLEGRYAKAKAMQELEDIRIKKVPRPPIETNNNVDVPVDKLDDTNTYLRRIAIALEKLVK